MTHPDPQALTSYLQLPHLLSLAWLAYPILSIIFVAFRLQASLASSQDAIASAKTNLLASCRAAERAATSTASMPRYLAIASNDQIVDAVNASLRAARAALVLSLTAMEAIINFIIDLYRSIFLCFLELVVRGGIAILVAAVQEINNVLAVVTSGLRTRIQQDIGNINGAIASAFDAINRVNPFNDITPPQLSVPNLDGLDNVALPSSFQESLLQLNKTIPSVSTIKEKLEEIISQPFELLKVEINNTFAEISFNSSTLPVPEQSQLSFCSDLDLSVVDDVGRDIVKTAKIGVVILLLIALLLIAFNSLVTWYKWRCMQAHLEYTRQAWNTDPTMHTKGSISATPQVALSNHNLMLLQANSDHPLITRITNQLAARLRLRPATHTRLQWFFNYIFHPPAAACLLIGLFGLILVEIQLAAMGPLVAKYRSQATEMNKDFSTLIARSINENMLNQSTIYAAQVNAQIDAVQTTINDGLFGWVETTTGSLNATVNEIYDDVQNGVTLVFGGTILQGVATEFIRCILGSKVDAIENALTFLHDNLKIDMPRVNNTALLLSPESVDEASAPIAAAALGSGSGDDEGLVGRLVNSYADTLRKERVTFGIFLALWGVVVLMGLLVLFYHSVGRPFIEKRRRKRYERKHPKELPEGFVVPFRDGTSTPPREWDEKRGPPGLALSSDGDLPSFTPLPSPRRSVFKPFWASRANSPNAEDKPTIERVVSNDTEKGSSPSKLKTFKLKLGGKANANDVDVEHEAAAEGIANAGWFTKVKGAFGGKKQSSLSEPDADYWEASLKSSPRQPTLRVIVDTPSDRSATNSGGEPVVPVYPSNSRWSTSPRPTKTSWSRKLLSPTSVVVGKKTQTAEPPVLRHQPSVPTDIGASFDDPFLSTAEVRYKPMVPSAYPIPLHSAAYDNTRVGNPNNANANNKYNNGSLVPGFPPPPAPRFVAPYPLTMSSVDSSSSSPAHRRMSSVPVWRVTNKASLDQMSVSSGASLDEGKRGYPTGQGQGQQQRRAVESEGQGRVLNPFITPFDNEHRVEVTPPPSNARMSIPTNPFVGGVAV